MTGLEMPLVSAAEMRRHMRRANPMPRVGTTAILLGIIAVTAGGFYWYYKTPVTQLQPGGKYKLTGGIAQVAAMKTLSWGPDTQTTFNTDGSAVLTGTFTGSAPTAVLAGATATRA
jgi:hypothetical protein